MTNKDMYRNVDKSSLAVRMYNVMKNAKSVTKETARGGVPYKIVTHNEVNNTIKAEMIKQGIIAIPSVSNHTREGNFTMVSIDMKFMNIDNPEDCYTAQGFVGYGVDPSDKGIGKAISYATKYALLKTFMLEIGDDEESELHNLKPEPISKFTQSSARNNIINQTKIGGFNG